MGRKASKATKNIYYIARYNASLKNDVFSSREKAAEQLGIERSRLARIELGVITPYAEEILIMAKKYDAMYLADDYCESVCPIGKQRALATLANSTAAHESLERLSLRFLSSVQSIDEITDKLVNISKDGIVTKNEYESFHEVLSSMDELSQNIKNIKDWINSDPILRSLFNNDVKDVK